MRRYLSSLFSTNVNRANDRGITPLMFAVLKSDVRDVRDLLRRGANPNRRNPDGETVLHMVDVTERNSGAKIIKMLVSHGANININNRDGRSPLHSAALRGSRPTLKALLDNGADINGRHSPGVDPPIFSFVWLGDLSSVKYMLKRGADINIKNRRGDSVLRVAISTRNSKMIKYLIGRGANANDLSSYAKRIALQSGVREINVDYKVPLHNRFNTYDPMSLNHVPLENAVMILGEHKQNGKCVVRHVYNKNYMNEWLRSGVHPRRDQNTYRSPGPSGMQFRRMQVLPLTNVLSLADKKRYKARYRQASAP